MMTSGGGRAEIEDVVPEIDAGRFPAKRIVGEDVEVTAFVFTDGHDSLGAVVRYRHTDEPAWREAPMTPIDHDRWRGCFTVTELGRYEYTIEAWVDRFATWRRDLEKRRAAGQGTASELLEGVELVKEAAARAASPVPDVAAAPEDARRLRDIAAAFDADRALDPELALLMARHPDRRRATRYARTLAVRVDRPRALAGAWYEMFPRSAGTDPARSATFREAEARLPYIAEMGFDVLYLPPIHPIGHTNRKGAGGALVAAPGDPGSPWAIGSEAGGHKSVDPALGTLDDFDHFVAACAAHGIEVALDIAFQCSPDHPYVREHPDWFRRRPDGTIRYAENPPKKYEDIYPLDFDCDDRAALWEELASVVLFWAARGIRIFRVDNPHTKPFAFWAWLLEEVMRRHPDAVFLAEAFTRPRVMQELAKLGFSQSYSYFTWRNTKPEITGYLDELTSGELRQYMRPNFFVNTPDILPEYLQFGGRPAFMIRLVLAATLGASYGIYGPPFELIETAAVPGTENYADSEKYRVRVWDLARPESLAGFIGRVNRIRRENPALQANRPVRFHPVDNKDLIFYSRATPDLDDVILVVVNLDPHHVQSGTIEIPLAELGFDPREPFQAHDLLSDARYLWHEERNFVRLEPAAPAHILRLRRRTRTERDFDYYL